MMIVTLALIIPPKIGKMKILLSEFLKKSSLLLYCSITR